MYSCSSSWPSYAVLAAALDVTFRNLMGVSAYLCSKLALLRVSNHLATNIVRLTALTVSRWKLSIGSISFLCAAPVALSLDYLGLDLLGSTAILEVSRQGVHAKSSSAYSTRLPLPNHDLLDFLSIFFGQSEDKVVRPPR